MLKRNLITVLFAAVLSLVSLVSVVHAQIADTDGLLVDIPEPPGARSELPSPIPMVYEFMGALMGGDYDVCLANFDVQTFLGLLFDRQMKRMTPAEYNELFAYQVQTHRNEFRFLAKIMNRVAGGAKISYSDPRYHKKVQSKVVIRIDTTKGKFNLEVYCRFVKERWYIYDYVLNNQRLTATFKNALKGIGIDNYVASLRPFYGEKRGFRPIKNKNFEFSFMVPSDFQIRENISDALLAAVGAFDGQFLLHVQAATYDVPQNLSQIGAAIKESLLPFSPRLFDQWKSEFAGVEIGNVLFHFMKNNKRLFTHMVIIPLGRKLVVLNFYHSSLQLLKHMTNLREKIIETLSLPKVEAAGGVLPGEIPDELTISSGNDFGDLNATPDPGFDSSDEISISPAEPPQDWTTDDAPEIPPPDENDDDMLKPDSYTSGGNDDYPEPPPPPDTEEDNTDDSASSETVDDEVPPPPPPPTDSYGDGSSGSDDDDYYPGPGEGSEVSF